MDLASNLAIAAGIIVEILLLWETSVRQKNVSHAPGALAPRLSRLQEVIGLVLLVSWGVIALADYFDPPLSLGALGALQSYIMLFSFAFLFAFGMVSPKLLPRINEQTIVVVSLVAFYGLFSLTQLEWVWLAALLLPALGVFGMALTTRVIHPYLKSLLYFWYLICLFIMALQSNFEMFIRPTSELELTLFDNFIGGAAGIFLLLHSIFLVRFFLMLTALILPANRHLIVLAMPKLFDDMQIPRLKFLGLLALFGGIVTLNRLTGLLPSISALNLLILLAVHFMERPFALTERL